MMLRSWMAPMGLHIEPATPRDADAVARLHAASFYRGWPRQDIEAYIIDPDTPTLVVCDARRKVVGSRRGCRTAPLLSALLVRCTRFAWRQSEQVCVGHEAALNHCKSVAACTVEPGQSRAA